MKYVWILYYTNNMAENRNIVMRIFSSRKKAEKYAESIESDIPYIAHRQDVNRDS